MRIPIIFIIASTFFFADADKIQCYFRNNSLHGYGCVAPDLITMNITGVRGKHTSGKTNTDVLYVEASSHLLNFIPEGTHDQFPNIKALSFNFDRLKEVTMDDLKPFGMNLTYLLISTNYLDVIPANMFASTPSITNLSFTSHNLKSIESGAFDTLKNVKHLSLNFPCKQSNATNPVNVKYLISSLNSCYNKNYPFKRQDRNPSVNGEEDVTQINIVESSTLKQYPKDNSNIFIIYVLLGILSLIIVSFVCYIFCQLKTKKKTRNPPNDLEADKSHELDKLIETAKIPLKNSDRIVKLNKDFGLIQKIEDSMLQVKSKNNFDILNLGEQDKKILIVTNVPQLLLSKIYNEIKCHPENKELDFKSRNIFVDAKVLIQNNIREEFEELVKSTNVERVFIISNDSNYPAILNISNSKIERFFIDTEVTNRPENYNLIYHEKIIKWQDLTEETQEFILKKFITFQGKPVKLSQILLNVESALTPEVLTILCSDKKITVNCDSKVEKLEKFIERTVQIKKKVKVSDEKASMISLELSNGSRNIKEKFEMIHEDFSLENFILETQDDRILIISDVAGSGKTTLLGKIHEVLLNIFPEHFVIFISLLQFIEELSDEKVINESFPDFIAKILKFDELERKIFMQKFKKGDVKILFDAFDEISPKCKENTIKLLQNFKLNGKNKFFITTRTHLEHDLEKDLKVLAHTIKILTKEEQVSFIVEFWEQEDRELVENSAKMLVDKIYEIISSSSSFIGVPLIVQGLAEAYKDKIDANFEREIQNLNISSIYEKIVDIFLNVLSSRFPQNPVDCQKKNLSLLQLHQFFAICLLFNDEFASSLGLNHDEQEWSHEEVARCGLIKYDKNGKFHFNHQTNAEYFISGFIFHLLKNVKKLSQIQLDFVFHVLMTEAFQVVRMFLDSMLNKVEKVQDLKSFNSSHKICEKVKKQKNFLQFCVREKLFNIFEFFILATKKEDMKLIKEVIELKNDDDKATNLMLILPYATNLTKFENFLDEIFNFHSQNVLDDFLLRVNNYGDTIFHYIAKYCKNTQVFKCFWYKIRVFFTDEAKLKSFLLMKGEYERNALLWSITMQNENTFYCLFEEVFCEFFSIKEIAYESARNGENLLNCLVSFGSVSMLKFAFEKLESEFSSEGFQNVIKLKSKNEVGYNLLHCAAISNKNEESVEFLVNFIENVFGNEEVKKMLSEPDNFERFPLQCAVGYNNLKVSEFFFTLCEQFFSNEQILQFLIQKDKFGDNLLHRAAAFAKSKEVFEFSWMKIEKLNENKEELKKFLLMKGEYGRNALLMSITHQNENIFYFLFEEVFCKFFSIKEFAYETGEDGENLLHHLAGFGSISMLKFAFEKLKNEFSPGDFQNLIKQKNKNEDGYNLLHCAAFSNSNEQSVECLVNFIENVFGSEEVKKMLSQLNGFNKLPLHFAVKKNTSKIFELIFSLYVKNFTKSEVENFLKLKVNNKNIFELAQNNTDDAGMFEAVKLVLCGY